ncbi:hypothetical protein L7F22_025769 [Adiantum nelumboides]|nr:hypothetical protein [Adiantum nelumboides]
MPECRALTQTISANNFFDLVPVSGEGGLVCWQQVTLVGEGGGYTSPYGRLASGCWPLLLLTKPFTPFFRPLPLAFGFPADLLRHGRITRIARLEQLAAPSEAEAEAVTSLRI